MKKIITYALGLLIVFSLTISSARASTIQEQYVSALQQVIVLLQQQVQLLVQQLNALQSNPPVSPVPLTIIPEIPPIVIQVPTPQPNPVPVTPTFGVVTPTFLGKINLVVKNIGFCADNANYFNGIDPTMYSVFVQYDENGTYLKVPVIISTDDDGYFDQSQGTGQIRSFQTVTLQTDNDRFDKTIRAETKYCSAKSSGIKFTATSNGVEKSVSL